MNVVTLLCLDFTGCWSDSRDKELPVSLKQCNATSNQYIDNVEPRIFFNKSCSKAKGRIWYLKIRNRQEAVAVRNDFPHWKYGENKLKWTPIIPYKGQYDIS